MVSGTGPVVMVSGTGRITVSVPVFIIETWRFPALDFYLEGNVFVALTRLADSKAEMSSPRETGPRI
jgi:hypothetical protein